MTFRFPYLTSAESVVNGSRGNSCRILSLIMLVEAVPRGYDASRREWLQRRAAPALAAELDLLRA